MTITLAALSLALGTTMMGAAPMAHADSTICSGFSDCASKGKTSHGYEGVYTDAVNGYYNGTPLGYWHAYAGHNCTNYVSYMLTQNGGGPYSTTSPGFAHEWDNTLAAPRDNNPTVGSIAQWEAYAGSALSAGHVAYVESVNSDGSITVSEDNYGDTFYWKTISPSSANWPTRFLHIADVVAPQPVQILNLQLDTDAQSELLKFDPSNDQARFYNVSSGGAASLIGSTQTWPTDWEQIIEVELDGDAQSELLLFDWAGNQAKFYDVSSGGGTTLLNTEGWTGNWNVVALELDGDVRSELLLFNPVNDTAGFYNLSPGGASSQIGSTQTWPTDWEQIIEVELDGDAQSELLLFDTVSNKAGFYDVSSTGTMSLQGTMHTWTGDWDVTALELDSDARSELLLFNSVTDTAQFYNVSSTGAVSQTGSTQTWTGDYEVVAVELDGDSQSELLLFNPSNNQARFYDVSSTGVVSQQGSVQTL